MEATVLQPVIFPVWTRDVPNPSP